MRISAGNGSRLESTLIILSVQRQLDVDWNIIIIISRIEPYEQKRKEQYEFRAYNYNILRWRPGINLLTYTRIVAMQLASTVKERGKSEEMLYCLQCVQNCNNLLGNHREQLGSTTRGKVRRIERGGGKGNESKLINSSSILILIREFIFIRYCLLVYLKSKIQS